MQREKNYHMSYYLGPMFCTPSVYDNELAGDEYWNKLIANYANHDFQFKVLDQQGGLRLQTVTLATVSFNAEFISEELYIIPCRILNVQQTHQYTGHHFLQVIDENYQA